jgi:hypothetical protein
MITKKSALSVSLSIGLVLLIGFWSNLPGEDKGRHDDKSEGHLVGSWDITIVGTPFQILRTFAQGGGVVDAYSFPPLIGIAGQDACIPTHEPLINSGGHGEWIRTGRKQFAVTVQYYQLDPRLNIQAQNLNSIATVRETIDVGMKFDTYTSTFETEISLPDGTLICTNSGTTEGKRITVEPLE